MEQSLFSFVRLSRVRRGFTGFHCLLMDLTGFLFQPDFNDEGVGGGGGDPQRGRGVDSGGGGVDLGRRFRRDGDSPSAAPQCGG